MFIQGEDDMQWTRCTHEAWFLLVTTSRLVEHHARHGRQDDAADNERNRDLDGRGVARRRHIRRASAAFAARLFRARARARRRFRARARLEFIGDTDFLLVTTVERLEDFSRTDRTAVETTDVGQLGARGVVLGNARTARVTDLGWLGSGRVHFLDTVQLLGTDAQLELGRHVAPRVDTALAATAVLKLRGARLFRRRRVLADLGLVGRTLTDLLGLAVLVAEVDTLERVAVELGTVLVVVALERAKLEHTLVRVVLGAHEDSRGAVGGHCRAVTDRHGVVLGGRHVGVGGGGEAHGHEERGQYLHRLHGHLALGGSIEGGRMTAGGQEAAAASSQRRRRITHRKLGRGRARDTNGEFSLVHDESASCVTPAAKTRGSLRKRGWESETDPR